jgi:YidC/Oxa1 family membrane protein insertase
MDRSSVIAVIVCIALIGLWTMVIVPRLYPPQPLPPGATNQIASPTAPAATPAASHPPTPATTTASSPAPAPLTRPEFIAQGEEQTLVLTNAYARYTFSSLGGGLKRIELLHYPETVSRAGRKAAAMTNHLAELNALVSVPVLAVLGDASVQGDGEFTLTRTAEGVRAEKTLTNGLRIIKEFQPTTNYLVAASVRLENAGSARLDLSPQEWVVGTATPTGPDDKGQTVGLMWYDGRSKQEIGPMWFENRTLGCFPGVPRAEYRAGLSNVVWVSAHNQFFALIAMPQSPAPQVVARPVPLPNPYGTETGVAAARGAAPVGVQVALAYPGAQLAPGETLERRFHFFAGPKEYRTLARLANRFKNDVDLVMGFGGFFGFFSKALLLSMNWLHHAFKIGYGWAIIVITIIIKLLFWPLTAASTRSMKRLQALQPQMKAIQEKYKDDPAKMNKKLMEFMKEHRVSPLGGCLPMLLQMPVFIGFFYMIRSAIELRGARFLWVADLSKPDTLFVIPGVTFLPFLSTPEGLPVNLLPLLMGATMLWQSHLTPPSPGMDPVQQKMMRFLPLIFLLFLYNFSSGLTLYWTVQNLLTILQTKLTKTVEPATAPASALTPPGKKKK